MKRVISLISVFIMAGGLLLALPSGGAPTLTVPAAQAEALTAQVYLPLVMNGDRRPTSDQLIDEALACGEIDSETALTYKVFAAFGDARLPAAYRGDDQKLVDSHIVAEVQYRYDSLSAATQAILNAFLIPPAYVGSWAQPLPAAAGLAPQAVRSQPPACGALAPDWTYRDGVHARVWWRVARQGDRAKADAFIASLDGTIGPALTRLMGWREPLSDVGLSCNGGTGKLDIYLEPSVERSYAASHDPPGCKHTPSYLVLNPGVSNSILAHEFMHAIQWGYNTQADCMYPGEYAWLAEATAEWAQDYVYPAANEEHYTAEWFFPSAAAPSLELKNDQHEYGAYLFFFYLVRSQGDPELVKRVWDNTERMDSLASVNQAIIGGFEAVWPQFARANVNQPPFDYYQKWDSQTVRAVAFDGIKNVRYEGMWPMTADVPHLGLVYQHFRFSGEEARLVTFLNGLTTQLVEGPFDDWVGMTQIDDGTKKFTFFSPPPDQIKGARVQAVFKIEGDDQWQWEDWTDKDYVSFCRDAKAERLEELVIIMSNSEYQDRNYWVRPLAEKPILMVSGTGCWRYGGTASEEMSGEGDAGWFKDLQWVDNLTFERTEAHPNIPYPFQTFQVQGGHWYRTYTARGECTADGSADKVLGGVMNWDKSLWTITGATRGPSVFRYLGYAAANVDLPVTVVCPDGTGVVTFADDPYFEPSGKLFAAGKVFKADMDGMMDEDVTLIEENGGRWIFKWTLLPQREP